SEPVSVEELTVLARKSVQKRRPAAIVMPSGSERPCTSGAWPPLSKIAPLPGVVALVQYTVSLVATRSRAAVAPEITCGVPPKGVMDFTPPSAWPLVPALTHTSEPEAIVSDAGCAWPPASAIGPVNAGGCFVAFDHGPHVGKDTVFCAQ